MVSLRERDCLNKNKPVAAFHGSVQGVICMLVLDNANRFNFPHCIVWYVKVSHILHIRLCSLWGLTVQQCLC